MAEAPDSAADRSSDADDSADRPSRRRRALSRETIIETAIAVIDDLGVDGLTMRNLGRALGVDPMTVYGYFPDKASLFDAVIESEAERLHSSFATLPDDPLEAVVAMMLRYREVLLEHPNLAPLVAARPVPQKHWVDAITLRLRLLRAVGFTDEDIPMAGNAIGRFCFGRMVLDATDVPRMAALGEDAAARSARIEAHLADLDDESQSAVANATFARRFEPDALAEEFAETVRAMVIGYLIRLGRPLPPGAAGDAAQR